MKTCAKFRIIVVENREPYYFIIVICKCKEVIIPIFLLDVDFNRDYPRVVYLL